jgi:hypothetical protein
MCFYQKAFFKRKGQSAALILCRCHQKFQHCQPKIFYMKLFSFAKIPAAAAAAVIAAAGCTHSTGSVIYEFDGNGKLIRKSESSESPVVSINRTSETKTLVMWESGWSAFVSASTATAQDPTPCIKLFAGKHDKGLISAVPGEDLSSMAAVIAAAKDELAVTKDGISDCRIRQSAE